MVIRGAVKKGVYFDSVTLMIVSGKLNALEGVKEASAVMGTRGNLTILASAGLSDPCFDTASDSDLLISVRAETDTAAEEALRQADVLLGDVSKKQRAGNGRTARTIAQAAERLAGANLALVSVAGKYAAAEAGEALEAGLHVMLFSDNVSLDDEKQLKERAVNKGLLFMGPDCGTAIINGVPLAFANKVRRGPVGIVAAAGTGLQEVSCLLDRHQTGISQAIGTGGRDVTDAIGGLSFLQAMQALAMDAGTECILLISKPPGESVLQKIAHQVRETGKPVVAMFIGGDPRVLSEAGVRTAADMEEAALLAAGIVSGEPEEKVAELLADRSKEIEAAAATLRVPPATWGVAGESAGHGADAVDKKYLRGIYSGGTLCNEAQLLIKDVVGPVYSNTPLDPAFGLENPWKSHGHTIVDLGEDTFTSGRPHPMIDFTLRKKRMLEEAADPETAVLLFDLVLGYGAHPAPLDELLPVIGQVKKLAPEVPVICSVTGTDGDPQDRKAVIRGLKEAGVVVMRSNTAAALLAARLLRT